MATVGVLPEWVTVTEASIITGVAEATLVSAARSGLVASAPLVKRKRGGEGILLLKASDLRAAGFFSHPGGAPPAAAAPVVLPVAAPPQAAPPATPSVAPPAQTQPRPVASPAPVRPAEPLPPLEPIARPAIPSYAQQLVLGPEREPRRLRPPRRKSTVVFALILALLAGAAGVFVLHRSNSTPGRTAPIYDGKPSSVAWVVQTQNGALVAVIGTPKGRPPVAVAIPEQTQVDLPDGFTTVGAAASTVSASFVAVQSVLQRRVGHAVVTTGPQLSGLVDSIAGLKVDTEAAFMFEKITLGPGPEKLTGAEVLAYLASATSSDDRTARWEDVMAGLFQTDISPTQWRAALPADDAPVIDSIMASARGAQVLELPTIEAGGSGGGSGGGAVQLQADRQATAKMLSPSFGSTLGPLVRVVVVNGSGRPGVGEVIATRIAPDGFWVVAAQNAMRFNVRHTKIVAANDGLLSKASDIQKALGVGSTYVSGEQTGVADITLLTGADYRG